MNTKKIINKFKVIILLITILSITVISCKNAFEIDPDGQLTEETTFINVADLQMGLNGSYANYNPESEVLFNAIFADNCKIGVDNGGQLVPLYNWKLTAGESNTTSIWNSNYFLLNNVNRVLRASEQITPDVAEEDDYNNIIGQLHALRAIAHFTLLSYFSTDYQDMNALSCIISDHVPETSEVFSRNTNGEVYSFIDSELTMAENLISDSFTNKEFITKDFLIGLRARIALTKGDYANAITYANNLIAKYPLANVTQYKQMFNDSDTSEVILNLKRNGYSLAGIFYFTNSAGPMWEVSNSLYQELDVNDVRREVIVNFTAQRGGPSLPADNFILINKYPGPAPAFINNFKAMRVSEMYLIRAESEAQLNQLTDVATTVKMLRDARFGNSTVIENYANKNQAIESVINERRKELAYEGFRYLDLKRTKMDIARNSIDCADGGSCFLPSSDFKFTLPIPLVELNANSNITQNPGYNN